MPTNAINDTGVKYLYDKLHGEIEPIAEAVSDSEVTIEGNPLNFNTLSSQNAKSTILSLEPIQDLHGYDKPWIGGAGKNLLDNSLFEVMGSGTSFTQTLSSVSIITNGVGGYQGIKVPSEEKIFKAGTYYIKANVKSATNYSFFRIGFRKVSNNSFVQAMAPSSTGEYAITSEITEDCYFSIIVNGSTPTANSVVIENLIVSATDVPFEPYENICPISGRSEIGILGCGKNLLPHFGNKQGTSVTGTVDKDGIISLSGINGSSTFNMYVGDSTSADNSTINLSNGNYKLSGGINSNIYIILYDGNRTTGTRYNDTGNGVNFTVTQGYITIYIAVLANVDTNGKKMYPMIRKSTESDATFEPYTKSNDLTISFGQTVYGGTLDVENGVLVVDRAKTSTKDITLISSIGTSENGVTRFFVYPFPEIDFNRREKIISDRLEFLGTTSVSGNLIGIAISSSYLTSLRLQMPASLVGTTESSISTYLQSENFTICVPLATPITINLTPHTINLLKGVNNISTDGDKITLTYRDGSVATLGDLTSAVDNLDSKIDESKILTDTATGDKYILVVTNGVLDIQQISN